MPLEETHKWRLPLYGPLKIQNSREYLRDSKLIFEKAYNSQFQYEVKLEDFELLHTLGRGAFGKVLLARYKLFEQSYYAVKVLSKKHLVKKDQVQHALNEKRILQSLNNPFCVRMEYYSKDNSNLYFFLPFVCGGEMFTHLRKAIKFEENLARFYAAQVVLGLEYLHNLNLVFRDLKPENLLIDHFGYLKITDFGFTKLLFGRTYTFCGTPEYIAPEVILGQGYGKAVDWWALGVLIYEMSSGHAPFTDPDQMLLFAKIIKKHFKMDRSFSSVLQDLVRRLLQADVTRRIGCLKSGVEDIKYHAWFKHTDWHGLLNRVVAAPFVPSNTDLVNTQYFPNLKQCSDLKISETCKFKDQFKEF